MEKYKTPSINGVNKTLGLYLADSWLKQALLLGITAKELKHGQFASFKLLCSDFLHTLNLHCYGHSPHIPAGTLTDQTGLLNAKMTTKNV